MAMKPVRELRELAEAEIGGRRFYRNSRVEQQLPGMICSAQVVESAHAHAVRTAENAISLFKAQAG